uniref:Uncharacterized protein n=1 Tax=Physcomitrium patens TaxID=3218 RepID=A0A7I4FDS6_PHYPA
MENVDVRQCYFLQLQSHLCGPVFKGSSNDK